MLHRHRRQGHVGLLLLDRRSGTSVRYDTAVAPMILPLRNRLAQRLNRTRSSIDPKASFTSAALLSDQRLFGEERVCPLDGIPGGCGARSHPPSLLGDNKRLPPFLQIFRCTRDCSDYPDDGSLCINTSRQMKLDLEGNSDKVLGLLSSPSDNGPSSIRVASNPLPNILTLAKFSFIELHHPPPLRQLWIFCTDIFDSGPDFG